LTEKWTLQKQKVTELTQEVQNMQTKLSSGTLGTLKELIPGFDESKLKTTEGIKEVIGKLQEIDNQKAEQVRNELSKLG
jgi:endonuclease III-like uncharacterized protein